MPGRGVGGTRLPEERDRDFVDILRLRKKGKTWVEVAHWINKNRDYMIPSNELCRQFNNDLKKTAIEKVKEAEVETIIDDLNNTMLTAMKAWHKSCKPSIQKKYAYVIKSGVKVKTSEAIEVMKSHGDPRFLKVFLSAIDKKLKLLQPTRNMKDFDINLFFSDYKLDDDFDNRTTIPIHSEDDLDEESLPTKKS